MPIDQYDHSKEDRNNDYWINGKTAISDQKTPEKGRVCNNSKKHNSSQAKAGSLGNLLRHNTNVNI